MGKENTDRAGGGASAPSEGYRFSAWKKGVCGGAAALVLLGLCLVLFAGGQSESGGAAKSSTPTGGAGFLPDGTKSPFPGSEGESAQAESDWGPALLRGGVGFFIGLAVGYALRTLFRASLAVVGLVLLALLGFSYVGWVEVRWDAVQEDLTRWGEVVQKEFTGFRTFILGTIPATGLSGLVL